MSIRGIQSLSILTVVLVYFVAPLSINGQEAEEPKIDFTTAIQPIIEARCATCHNENDEAGGLDLNDQERFLEYVETGKPLESSFFQSLTGSNDWSQMPPEEDDDGNPLEPCTSAEMALIYLWIQQGASFAGVPEPEQKEETRSSVHRLFLFSGFFHPAIVHFPIALITMSAFFIIVFFRNDALSDDAAFYLLLFGTLASIVACVFGWAFAEIKAPGDIGDFSKNITRHRWFGIGATVLALVSTILAWRARNEVMANRSGMWKFGVILTAALMGLVGHQGGEEVYGEGVYERNAEKLIPEFWPFGKEEKPAEPNNTSGEGDEKESDKTPIEGDQKADDSSSENKDPDQDQNADEKSDSDDVKQDAPPSDPTIKKDD